MAKRVIELIRVSTEGQAAHDRAGIPSQRSVNRRTAAAYGLEIVESFEMSDVSGAAVLYAPEMQRLIQLLRTKQYQGVVAREFSRLMRPENFYDFGLLQEFVNANAALYLPEGPVDFSNKTGRLMGAIRAAIAGLERTEILERIWHAKEEKRRQGKFAQSRVCLPFGVGYEEQKGWFYTSDAEKVREAFRLFLAGETSYWSIGKRLGIKPVNLRIIMRNPIYTGWRVIDKRRDPSAAAHKAKADGRQADRPKVMRSPEEIIRVRVIQDGLITEDDFQRAQQIMATKRTRHWRANPNHVHQFTYNGFLSCSDCGDLVYTYANRRENRYYVCKGKQYPTKTETRCGTGYMRRELLEEKLDELFSSRLTSPDFLGNIAKAYESKSNRGESQSKLIRLQSEITSLASKKQRVLETYFDGIISRPERDKQMAGIERDTQIAQDLMLRAAPDQMLSPEALAEIFLPFHEWKFLGRDDKRRLLSVLVPEIRVADYKIEGLLVMPPTIGHNQNTHSDKGSWPLPA